MLLAGWQGLRYCLPHQSELSMNSHPQLNYDRMSEPDEENNDNFFIYDARETSRWTTLPCREQTCTCATLSCCWGKEKRRNEAEPRPTAAGWPLIRRHSGALLQGQTSRQDTQVYTKICVCNVCVFLLSAEGGRDSEAVA